MFTEEPSSIWLPDTMLRAANQIRVNVTDIEGPPPMIFHPSIFKYRQIQLFVPRASLQELVLFTLVGTRFALPHLWTRPSVLELPPTRCCSKLLYLYNCTVRGEKGAVTASTRPVRSTVGLTKRDCVNATNNGDAPCSRGHPLSPPRREEGALCAL